MTEPYLVLEGYYKRGEKHEWSVWGDSTGKSSSTIAPVLKDNISWAKKLAYIGREWNGKEFKVRIVEISENKKRKIVYQYQCKDKFTLIFGKKVDGKNVVLDNRTDYDFKSWAENDADQLEQLGYWTKITKQ